MTEGDRPALRVLLVEDSRNDAEMLERELGKAGFAPTIRRVEQEEDMRAGLSEGEWDLVISDYTMPRFDAVRALRVAKELKPDVPFIIVSGTVGEETAVTAMREGAHDYLLKGNFIRLGAVVRRALGDAAMRRAHRESELALQQAQKMGAVARLAGGIAHDFNNMLTVIMGRASQLLDRTLEEPVRKGLMDIMRAADRSAGLTQQLLLFSRRKVAESALVDLNALISDTCRLLRRVLGEDVDVSLSLDPALAPVRVVPGQIEQVVMNLCVNARDAMPKGGTLRVVTRRVDVETGTDEAAGWTQIEVVDTGVGMAPETRAHIFDPFFTTKEPGKGTGLGLSIVYGIIQQHGGRIEVESEAGAGTTFRLFLPHGEGGASTQPSVPPAPASPAAGCGETILLAEDEEPIREMLRSVLAASGYRVLAAGDGETALGVLGATPEAVHLLATDVVMPRMGGVELARHARALRPGLKCLFLSGYTAGPMGGPFHLPEDAAFLQKPFTPRELCAKIREVLDSP